MANVQISAGTTFTINGVNAYFIGDTDAGERVVGTYALLLVSASFVGSVTVKATSSNPAAGMASGTPQTTPVQCAYLSDYLNGTALSAPAYNNAALTDTSHLWVPCTGRQVVLDCTAFTSGALTVYMVPTFGAAA